MSTVLIIDDENDVRRLVAMILRRAGLDIIEAANGRAGVEAARRDQPDLIICDVNMPEVDGYEVLRQLGASSDTATIPFVFLTGQVGMDELRQGMDLGADDYLEKPFGADELIAAVRARLAKRLVQQKVSEEKLDDLRGKIMYVLPHELRTPLSAILGLAEILASEADTMDRGRIKPLAQGLVDSAERLRRIIENYLVYSQIEIIGSDAQRIEALRSERTPIAHRVIASLALVLAQRANRKNDLVFDIDGEIPPLQISQEDLEKVFGETIDNALKFSSAGDPVEISVATENGMAVLSVADHGRGMTKEQINQVGAYQQFDRESYEQQGSGLGLVIAKRLTEVHGGSFSIDSVPNVRTTVTVRLPCAT